MQQTPSAIRSVSLCVALASALAAAVAGGCAADRVVAPAETRSGVLTDWYAHKTLYTYDKDSTNPTQSACDAECAMKWPPYRPREGERAVRGYTVFKRTDGSLQWAYNGKPLYFYAGDQKVGDKSGDGVGGVWHAAKQAN
jgi:predicted lipoprotein with Yx(FWY)xxD motif